jgi:hypothetical protein
VLILKGTMAGLHQSNAYGGSLPRIVRSVDAHHFHAELRVVLREI